MNRACTDSMRPQMAMDRRSTFLEAPCKIMKRIDSTGSAITLNMR